MIDPQDFGVIWPERTTTKVQRSVAFLGLRCVLPKSLGMISPLSFRRPRHRSYRLHFL